MEHEQEFLKAKKCFEKAIEIQEKVSKEKQAEILKEYIQIYDINDDQTQWFEKVKVLASKLGYEKVGDVAMVIRVALTHRTKSPDLYQVMKVLGTEKVIHRLEKYIG